MPRIIGVEIPNNKKIEFSLRYLFGIGPTRSKIVLRKAEVDPNKRSHELTEEELNRISEVINELGYIIEGDLRREITSNLKRMTAIKCYRGLRHLRGLPVRGQRTRTNARTRKGARKTVGVVRKKE